MGWQCLSEAAIPADNMSWSQHIKQHVTVLMLPTCNLGVLLGWLLFSDMSAATMLPGADAADLAGTAPGLSEWAAPTGLCAGGEGGVWML